MTYLLLASNFFNPCKAVSKELLACEDGFKTPGVALSGEKWAFGELLCDLFWDEPDVLIGSEAWVSITDSR